MPRVSIIVPTYNCSRFIEKALRSVFAQTYNDFEVIVVNDGSTDNTSTLLEKWSQLIIYLYQPNQGVSAARNLAISKSSGEFIAYLDADDIWCPTKLEKQVAFLDSYPNIGLVHSDASIIDENDSIIHQRYNFEKQRSPNQGYCIKELLDYLTIIMPTVIERHECFIETIGFDKRLQYAEDYLRWVQLSLEGYAFGYIDEPLVMYRQRAGSLSRVDYLRQCEFMVHFYQILLDEEDLAGRAGMDIELDVRKRLNEINKALPYFYRLEGRNDLAREKALALIKASPSEIHHYIDLLKSYVPSMILKRIMQIRR